MSEELTEILADEPTDRTQIPQLTNREEESSPILAIQRLKASAIISALQPLKGGETLEIGLNEQETEFYQYLNNEPDRQRFYASKRKGMKIPIKIKYTDITYLSIFLMERKIIT